MAGASAPALRAVKTSSSPIVAATMRHFAIPCQLKRMFWGPFLLVLGCAIEDDEWDIFRDHEGVTVARLWMLRGAMQTHLERTGRWPTGIDTVLAILPRSYDRYRRDAWGTPAVYAPGPPCGTLLSLGPDSLRDTGDELFVRFPIALCAQEDVSGISAYSRAALREYVGSLIALNASPDRRNHAVADSLFAHVLRIAKGEGNNHLVYVLFLANVGGEQGALELTCKVLERGEDEENEMGHWIRLFQKKLPLIGIEPLPASVLGDGRLPHLVLARLSADHRC